ASTIPAASPVKHTTVKVWLPQPLELCRVRTNRAGVQQTLLNILIHDYLFFCLGIVVPSQAQKVQVVEVTNSSLHISWEPGFGGVYPVSVCSIQAAPSGPDRNTLRNLLIHNQNVYVPPAQHLIPELKPYTFYDVSVACRSSHGASPWTPWVALHTAEGDVSLHQTFSWHWWYVVMGIAVSLALIGFIVYAIIL
uniref:Fibronectin type-III domain-containing protein n=1 Tax=Oncorhynchus tshawytscha TaxID=74940 RepID=A0AAZ3PL30_ONCTS